MLYCSAHEIMLSYIMNNTIASIIIRILLPFYGFKMIALLEKFK